MKTLFIIDIDGTLAHAGRRFREAGPEPDRNDGRLYEEWVRRVQSEESLSADEPVIGMKSLLHGLGCSNECIPVYLTSREEVWRKTTRSWLDRHRFPYFKLIMRSVGNYSEGGVFKENSIDILCQENHVSTVVVLDDDGKGDIEDMCKRRGWTFLKARSGGQE